MKKLFYTLGLACILSLGCISCDKKSSSSSSSENTEKSKGNSVESQLNKLQGFVEDLERMQATGNVNQSKLNQIEREGEALGESLAKLYQEDKMTPAQEERFQILFQRLINIINTELPDDSYSGYDDYDYGYDEYDSYSDYYNY